MSSLAPIKDPLTLIEDFATAVDQARAHQGRKDYSPMAKRFVDLTQKIEPLHSLLTEDTAKDGEAFLREANGKMMEAAQGFAELFSFSGEPKVVTTRAYKIFDRSVAGFAGTRNRKDQVLHYRSMPPSYVLEHLWVGLPRFATGENVEGPAVRPGYESLIALEGAQTLIAMARAAKLDITFICPNTEVLYTSNEARRQDPINALSKNQVVDRRQELGDAFVFPRASSAFAKIVISMNLEKSFREKYPASLAALEKQRQRQQVKKAESAPPPAPVPAGPQTKEDRARMLEAHMKANPNARVASAPQLLAMGKISLSRPVPTSKT